MLSLSPTSAVEVSLDVERSVSASVVSCRAMKLDSRDIDGGEKINWPSSSLYAIRFGGFFSFVNHSGGSKLSGIKPDNVT